MSSMTKTDMPTKSQVNLCIMNVCNLLEAAKTVSIGIKILEYTWEEDTKFSIMLEVFQETQ